MPQLTFEQVKEQVRAKKPGNIYLLHGAEPYFIDVLCNMFIDELIPEDARDFNLNVLYGPDDEVPAILSALSQFPMGSDYQVVVVKNAQKVKDLNLLHSYAAKPFPSAVLVLAHYEKKLDGKLKLFKAIDANHGVFESKPLWDNQLPGWIKKEFSQEGKKITDFNAGLIAEFLGNDLRKIDNEIRKLLIVTEAEKEITQNQIEKYIGISRNFNVFELCSALVFQDAYKANLIANYLAENMKEGQLPMLISGMYNYFLKLFQLAGKTGLTDQTITAIINTRSITAIREYKTALQNYSDADVQYVISLLAEYDQYSKGMNIGDAGMQDLLRELIFKILNSSSLRDRNRLIESHSR
jgi:DNA polymerase-3 subunit delta